MPAKASSQKGDGCDKPAWREKKDGFTVPEPLNPEKNC